VVSWKIPFPKLNLLNHEKSNYRASGKSGLRQFSEKTMKILVSKVCQLGDTVVFLSVIDELRRRFGKDVVYVHCSPFGAPFLEDLLPPSCLDVTVNYDFKKAYKKPLTFLKLLRKFRRERWDAILLPFDQGTAGFTLSRLSGCGRRIGMYNPRLRVNGFLTTQVKSDLASPMALQNWQLVLALAKELGEEDWNPPAEPPAPDFSHLISHPLQRDPKRVLIHTGASRPYKQWPVGRYVSLANELQEQGYSVVWCNQGGEEGLASGIERWDQTGLKEFIRRAAECGLFVGNNSGPMNIMNALGLPMVIFSGPSPTKWDPYWYPERVRNLRIPELVCQPCDHVDHAVNVCGNTAEPLACMNRLSVSEVRNEIEELWREVYSSKS
jgi:ADP-heptose:LPS heptosyltransferase